MFMYLYTYTRREGRGGGRRKRTAREGGRENGKDGRTGCTTSKHVKGGREERLEICWVFFNMKFVF